MALHFSKQEFLQRKTKVLQSMKEQNLDAILIFRQESMYWLTGYDTFGYVFFQTLVLDNKGNNFLAAVNFNKQNKAGVAFLDISTGEFYVGEGSMT